MPITDFIASCRAELALMQTLCALLSDEQRALLALDGAPLQRLARDKEALLAQLAAASAPRLDWQQACALGTPQQLQQWLSDKDEARAAWLALEAELRRAQVVNQVNADLARERGAMAESLQAELMQAMRNDAGYGRNGEQASGVTGSRRLGSA